MLAPGGPGVTVDLQAISFPKSKDHHINGVFFVEVTNISSEPKFTWEDLFEHLQPQSCQKPKSVCIDLAKI